MTNLITRRSMLVGTGKVALVASTVPAVIATSRAATGEFSSEFEAVARTFDRFAELARDYEEGGSPAPVLDALLDYKCDTPSGPPEPGWQVADDMYRKIYRTAAATGYVHTWREW